MEHVGRHGAEDPDHDDGEPVRPRHVATHAELEHEGDDEADEPERDAGTGWMRCTR